MIRATTFAGAAAIVATVPAGASTPRLVAPHAVVKWMRVSARTAIHGGALPQVGRSQLVGRAAAGGQVDSVVFLRPRNAWLLHQVAEGSTARAPLSGAMINRLFLPAPASVRSVEAFLSGEGLRVVGMHSPSIEVRGSVAATERAFGVSLNLYRGADGRVFRAPSAAPSLPRGIATAVQAVGGLDTALRLHRATAQAPAIPSTVTATCAGANNAKSAYPGSLLPADMGLPTGYNHTALINGGSDGTGETIAFMEFSDYKRTDTDVYRACFPAITSNPPTVVGVDGGTTDESGAGEVVLDIEVAMSAAPAADTVVYETGNNLAHGIDMLNAIRANAAVHEVSDSWGICEPVLPASLVQAENTALELNAVAGKSVFVATGDSGSSDCRPLGLAGLFTDDPASQPFATGVGGTRLAVSPYAENAWKYGGGGVSLWWPKPQYQAGKTLVFANGGLKCGNTGGQCRQVPDIALDANPLTGYIVYCTAGAIKCGLPSGFPTGWLPIGGTSGAAPLMAGITADANTYSTGNAGQVLGFANPFLYANAGTSVFHDITTGSNSITGGSSYTAQVGYDLTTGLGSVDAQNLATALAAASPSVPNPDTTTLTADAPLSTKTITYGQPVTFHGTLTDSTTASPIANKAVYVQTSVGIFRDTTDASGIWSITLLKALTRNLTWHAVFVGSDTLLPASFPATPRHVYVVPHLTSAADLPVSNGAYVVKVGTFFTFHGVSTPNMHGAHVTLQDRAPGSSTWHSLFLAGVGIKGGYALRIRGTRRGSVYLRWEYFGGTTKTWMTAVSPPRLVRFT